MHGRHPDTGPRTPHEGTTTNWLGRRRQHRELERQRTPAGRAIRDPAAPDPRRPFVCSTCGRTDLPEAGGWNPPICLECDAAINEDALFESGELEP